MPRERGGCGPEAEASATLNLQSEERVIRTILGREDAGADEW